jgi:glutamyl endopeptidase
MTMRFTLQVDEEADGVTTASRGGESHGAGSAPWASSADIDAGRALEASAAQSGTAAAGEHTSVSSPGADEAGGGVGESQEPPGAGAGEEDAAEGGMEEVDGYELPDAEAAAEALVEVDEDLPDISVASFGEAPEAVIGVDDRVQIAATSTYPWSVHASLRITANDGSQWIGTGWFIGPHTLVTAGHVVFIKNSGVPNRDGWVRSITVIPGRNGALQPFGSAVSSNLRSVTGWTTSGNQEYDYGAIILSTDLGARTGWLGFGAYSDATLLASLANISGYPGDKPAGTQWYHARNVSSVGPRKVYYDVDTFGGQSGSAVYRIVNGQRFAVAVHTYGGATSNSGTRITSPVFNNLVAWKA